MLKNSLFALILLTLALTGCGGGGDGEAAPVYNVSGAIIADDGLALVGITVSNGGSSATSDTTGKYTIALSSGAHTLTPTKSGFTFTPATLTVTANGPNVTVQDFKATLANYMTPKTGIYRGVWNTYIQPNYIYSENIIAYVSSDGKFIGANSDDEFISSKLLALDSTGKFLISQVQYRDVIYRSHPGATLPNADVSNGSVSSLSVMDFNLSLPYPNDYPRTIQLTFDPASETETPSLGSISGDYSNYSASGIFYNWDTSLRIDTNGNITGKRKSTQGYIVGAVCAFSGSLDTPEINQKGPNFATLNMSECDDKAIVRAVVSYSPSTSEIFVGVIPENNTPIVITAFQLTKGVLPSNCSPNDHPYCL